MVRRPPRSTLTDTLFPSTPLFRSLVAAVEGFWGAADSHRFVVLTGGEPMLQVDDALVAALHARGFEIAIETNGTLPAHPAIDWVCVSPKAGSEDRKSTRLNSSH